MKNSILFALVAGCVFFTACNKGGSMADYRVKKITSGKGQSTEFTYSPDHKIAMITTSDSTKVTFVYNGNNIVQTVANPASGQSRVQNMHVTAAGYMDSSMVNDPRGNYLTLNTHDADGFTTVSQEYFAGVLKRTTQSTFKDGNEIVRTVNDENMKPLGNIYFEYFTDKTNSLAPENQGMKFLGKDSKNLMKKVVQVLAKGDTVGVATFSYQFDDKGRITSKATYEKGVQADSSTISYY